MVVYMKEIEITKNDSGQRADKFLMKYFNKAPKSFIYKMLRKKRIKLNGCRAEGTEMLSIGDKIQMYLADETIDSFIEKKYVKYSDKKFDVVYEDDNILVVNKPAGILSHAESSSDKDTLIDQILSYLYEKGEYNPNIEKSFVPALCNRLDRNTSGIIVVGKTSESLRQLNAAIKTKSIKKLYKTLVLGTVKKAGRLEDFYSKDENTNKASLGEGDKKVVTEYRPLKTNGKYTLMEVNLITGKSHQIRVHMSSIKCPIVGDIKYGNNVINSEFRKSYGVKRQLLHAYKMIFNGLSGELEYLNGKIVEAEVPEDFKCAEKNVFQ